MSASEDAEKEYESTDEQKLLDALADPNSKIEFPSESVQVSFISSDFLFRGRLDKLVKIHDTLVVVDEKFTRRGIGCFRDKYVAQLSAYCHGLSKGQVKICGVPLGKAFSNLKLSCWIVERDIQTRKPLEKILFDFDQEEFNKHLSRFGEIVSSSKKEKSFLSSTAEERSLACNDMEKCAACEYRLCCGQRSY